MARDIPTICDRCGFQRRLCDMKKEWTGLVVCPSCWDPKPQMKPKPIAPEGLPKKNARPRDAELEEPRFVDPANPVSPDDFLPSSGFYIP